MQVSVTTTDSSQENFAEKGIHMIPAVFMALSAAWAGYDAWSYANTHNSVTLGFAVFQVLAFFFFFAMYLKQR